MKIYYYNMSMCKKTLTALLLIVLSFLTSCVDYNYDLLNKEVSIDVKVEGNTVALPVGSLKPILLDSILNVDEIEMLEKNANGAYSISFDDSISAFEEMIDPIELAIEPIEHAVKIEFVEPNIDSVHLDGSSLENVEFTTPSISFSDLNNSLPRLTSRVEKKVTNSSLDAILEGLKNDPNNPALNSEVKINDDYKIEDSIECNIEYQLPDLVERIDSIQLTSPESAQGEGTLVEILVTHPKALNGVEKIIDFEIVFPEYFVLSEAVSEGYVVSDNKVTATDLVLDVNDATTSIKFNIDRLVDIDKKTNKDTRCINIKDEIAYTIYYKVDGSVVINNELTDEYFKLFVDFVADLEFSDVSGKTKDITVDFDPKEMGFNGHFDDLEYIDEIKSVQFDKEQSSIKFKTNMNMAWLDGFSLKDGYEFKIAFPDSLSIDKDKSDYDKENGVRYDADKHAFYISDLKNIGNMEWTIIPDKLVLNVPVEGNICELDLDINMSFVNNEDQVVDHLVLDGVELESMATTLEEWNLTQNKHISFDVLDSDFVIEDAVVHTNYIHSVLDTYTNLTLDEKIPSEISRVDAIGLDGDVAVKFNLEIVGLEDVGTAVHLDFHVAMPSFLKLSKGVESYTDNSKINVEIIDDTLYVKADYHPSTSEPLYFELLCPGFDFRTEEFDYKGLTPKDSTDGNTYLSYMSDIALIGDAYIDDMDFKLQVLEKINDININLDVEIEKAQIKTLHGIYGGEIEKIEETFELDFGEDLDFLRNEDNTITLADPQIEIILDNPVCVPMDVSLQILGKDESGVAIPTSEIITTFSILPANYDDVTGEITPEQTKLFFTTDAANSKQGYQNVVIENLANLLEQLPNSIDFKIEPVINTDKTHHIDISKPLTFEGAYSVIVPLKFENFNMCYNDTISGLQGSLGETLDMFTNVSLRAKMNIINTIPLGLSLSVKPLDENGNLVEDLEIGDVNIMAGNGGKIISNDATAVLPEAQPIELFIRSKTGNFSELDKLSFSIVAAADHTAGSIGLMGEQGIKISNIVFEVSGDFETVVDK